MNWQHLLGATAIVAVCASPAWAGEEVLYRAAPDWVVPADLDSFVAPDTPTDVLRDVQYRFEGGVVHRYIDEVTRFDNPQALTRRGTQQITWYPDKGDLTVHRLQILRGGETIDLIAQGVTFDVLRRERGLEMRLLDGQLTATLAVPQLQAGDMLRLAYTTTVDDQALGANVQAQEVLPTEPARLGMGRLRASWPSDAAMQWRVSDDVAVERSEAGGFITLAIATPVAERDNMPGDAPVRFQLPAMLQATSFGSWEELSRVMYPHFDKAARFEDGSPLDRTARGIMAEHKTSLARAAAATRLVQDEISYLLNGLNGGNYLPQSATETWDKRYGDCKAKSVLLLALLRRMDIAADLVLVDTRRGDAVPVSLPLPGAFNHIIVRATIAGQDYWLDGTSTATRLANMGDIPPFYHALPLSADGAGLVALPSRFDANPQAKVALAIDNTAGIDMPTLIRATLSTTGPQSAMFKSLLDDNDPEKIDQFRQRMRGGPAGLLVVSKIELKYDDALARADIVLEGIGRPIFSYDEGKFVAEAPFLNERVNFNANRARPKWREIPVASRRQAHAVMDIEMALPKPGAATGVSGYTLEGGVKLDESFGLEQVVRDASIDDNVFTLRTARRTRSGEIAAEDIAAMRRRAVAINKQQIALEAKGDVRRVWDYSPAELARMAAPLRERFDVAVGLADEDETEPLEARADFLADMFEFDAAIADYDAILAEEPSAPMHWRRGVLYRKTGQWDAALEDFMAAYDLDPTNARGYDVAYTMGLSGAPELALDWLDALPAGDDDLNDLAANRAYAMGQLGDHEGGLAVLEERLLDDGNDADLLNSACWYRGIYAIADAAGMAVCNRAVERSDANAAPLDSRAMMHFRMGDLAAALADSTAAVRIAPASPGNRALRGVILRAMGEAEGEREIARALRIDPSTKARFALYGIAL